jgi:hypothetical protein
MRPRQPFTIAVGLYARVPANLEAIRAMAEPKLITLHPGLPTLDSRRASGRQRIGRRENRGLTPNGGS